MDRRSFLSILPAAASIAVAKPEVKDLSIASLQEAFKELEHLSKTLPVLIQGQTFYLRIWL